MSSSRAKDLTFGFLNICSFFVQMRRRERGCRPNFYSAFVWYMWKCSSEDPFRVSHKTVAIIDRRDVRFFFPFPVIHCDKICIPVNCRLWRYNWILSVRHKPNRFMTYRKPLYIYSTQINFMILEAPIFLFPSNPSACPVAWQQHYSFSCFIFL